MPKQPLTDHQKEEFESQLLEIGLETPSDVSFFETVDKVVELLKTDMQGNGYFKQLRNAKITEKDTKERKAYESTFSKHDYSQLDRRINSFASELYLISKIIAFDMHYNLLPVLQASKVLDSYPYLQLAVKILLGNQISPPGRDRLRAILQDIASQSNRQSNVSKAGRAGELIVKGILEVAGGLEERHFQQQVVKKSADIVSKFLAMHESGGIIPEQFKTKKFSQRLLRKRWGNQPPNITATSLADDYVHYSQPRSLTVREWARLQMFPDWYEFAGKRTTGGLRRAGNPREGNFDREVPKYTQIGNAVPVELARQVGLHFQNILNQAESNKR